MSNSRLELWAELVRKMGARTVAEVGVYRGEFAAAILDGCPAVERYYMVDPWRHIDRWNKPLNVTDQALEGFYRDALTATDAHSERRVILRGTTTEVIDRIPDGSLDFAYIDGDHTLHGITVDLIRVWPKIRDGGTVGGDDFDPAPWRHGTRFEPTLVFPFAVYFAEAVDAPIQELPGRQFLIEKRTGFVFDGTGPLELRDTMAQPVRDRATLAATHVRRRLSGSRSGSRTGKP